MFSDGKVGNCIVQPGTRLKKTRIRQNLIIDDERTLDSTIAQLPLSFHRCQLHRV